MNLNPHFTLSQNGREPKIVLTVPESPPLPVPFPLGVGGSGEATKIFYSRIQVMKLELVSDWHWSRVVLDTHGRTAGVVITAREHFGSLTE